SRVAALALPLVTLALCGFGLGPLCPVPRPLLLLALALAAFVPAATIAGMVTRHVLPGVTWSAWAREQLVLWAVFYPALGVALFLMVSLPWRFPPLAGLMLGAGGAVMLFFAIGGGVWLGRAVGLFRPAGPRLSAIVGRAAARASMPPVVTYEVGMAQ